MADPARWYDLACACGSTTFTKLYAIRRHSAGGSSTEETGLRCTQCDKLADTAAMWGAIQRQRLRQQLADMEEQLTGDAPVVPPAPGSLHV